MPPTTTFNVANIRFGANAPFFLIAGPCVIESEAHATSLAEKIAAIASDLDIPYIFKAPYDKPNRSSVPSFRAPHRVEGLRTLPAIKKRTGLPILSDVHD